MSLSSPDESNVPIIEKEDLTSDSEHDLPSIVISNEEGETNNVDNSTIATPTPDIISDFSSSSSTASSDSETTATKNEVSVIVPEVKNEQQQTTDSVTDTSSSSVTSSTSSPPLPTPISAAEPPLSTDNNEKDTPSSTSSSSNTTTFNVQLNGPVSKFYKGKNILLTGATGFVGKAVLWKLIHSLGDSIGKIYILVRNGNTKRSKMGRPNDRLKNEILNNKVIIY